MREISFAEANNQFEDVLDTLEIGEYTRIVRDDGKDVVVMSLPTFEQMMAVISNPINLKSRE